MSEQWKLIAGNCVEKMREMPENSVDSIVTDPPYGLEFMGKEWDKLTRNLMNPDSTADKERMEEYGDSYQGRRSKLPDYSKINEYGSEMQAWHKDWALEALRVLKPGGHLIAFSGSRTYHRMACAIEDAGFEIRDQIMWVYGSGFPKSHNVANDIDKRMGHPPRGRAIPMASTNFPTGKYAEEKLTGNKVEAYEPRSEEAKPWAGWGTALKPAHEPIVLARKPNNGTVATNVLKWGTGAINVDACRVETDGSRPLRVLDAKQTENNAYEGRMDGSLAGGSKAVGETTQGRWPANFIHDGSQEVLDLFPESNGGAAPKKSNIPAGKHYEGGWGNVNNEERREFGSGSAARFFYCLKRIKKTATKVARSLNPNPSKQANPMARARRQELMAMPRATPTIILRSNLLT